MVDWRQHFYTGVSAHTRHPKSKEISGERVSLQYYTMGDCVVKKVYLHLVDCKNSWSGRVERLVRNREAHERVGQ